MRKLFFAISIMVICVSTSFGQDALSKGKNVHQMGGRISTDSSIDFKPGVNKVHFLSEGVKVVGNLYIPKSTSKMGGAAIVIVGPKGAVKEQTQGIYAKKLAEEGYITLVFDHRTYGESGGYPRHYENPYMKIEDVKTAVSYISSLDIVDKNKISMLGVCNGGGFGAAAAIYDQRVKSYASIAGIFDLRSQILNGKSGDKIRWQDIMQKSADARQKYFETGEVDYVQQMPDIDENASQLRKEAYEYYRTLRGLVPNWGENKMVTFSMDTRRSYDITDQLSLLSPRPYLVIAGTNAMTLGLSEQAYERASEPKEMFKVEGASHIDLYDVEQYVNQAVSKLSTFYSAIK